ncbi:MAG: transcriptional repressor [Leptolinea sp.]|nr:transcriptional repressor [Leptolinea sp.]
MNTLENLTYSLKKAGLRITPQRMAICRKLCESNAHPTAFMIFDEIRHEYPSLSLATVYNTLDVLAGLGVVNVLGPAGDGRVHFDADTSPHVNLACSSCHRIVDVPTIAMDGLQDAVSQVTGFELRGARILYYGICPDCQKKNTKPN